MVNNQISAGVIMPESGSLVPHVSTTMLQDLSTNSNNNNSATDSIMTEVNDDVQVERKPAALIRVITKHEQDCFKVMILTKDSIVGRDSQCDFQITSIEVSRRHAKIEYRQNKWWIVNMNSTNGVFINGCKVGSCYPLLDGALVSFGPLYQSTFKYIFVENYHEYFTLQRVLCQSQISFEMPVQTNKVEKELLVTDTQKTEHTVPSNELESKRLRDKVDSLKKEKAKFESEKVEWVSKLKLEKARNKQMSKEMKKLKKKLCTKIADLEKTKKKLKLVEHENKDLSKQLKSQLSSDKETNNVDSNCPVPGETSNSQSTQPINESSHDGLLCQDDVANVLKEMTCSICCEYFIDPTSINCQHTFCITCIEKWKRELTNQLNPISISSHNECGVCPICRMPIKSQSQSLIFATIIEMLLKKHLNKEELEEREKLVQSRREELKNLKTLRPRLLSSSSSSSNNLMSNLLSVLDGMPPLYSFGSDWGDSSITVNNPNESSDDDAEANLMDFAISNNWMIGNEATMDNESNESIELIEQRDANIDEDNGDDEAAVEEEDADYEINENHYAGEDPIDILGGYDSWLNSPSNESIIEMIEEDEYNGIHDHDHNPLIDIYNDDSSDEDDDIYLVTRHEISSDSDSDNNQDSNNRNLLSINLFDSRSLNGPLGLVDDSYSDNSGRYSRRLERHHPYSSGYVMPYETNLYSRNRTRRSSANNSNSNNGRTNTANNHNRRNRRNSISSVSVFDQTEIPVFQ